MSDRIQEVAERANVPEDFVRQLVAAGALPGEEGELELAGAVRRVRLLRSWTAAGLSVETILTLVNRGALSLAFLDAPVMALPERLEYSYEQLAAHHGVPMSFLQALHQSLGFAPPEPGDRAGEDDAAMLEVARLFRGAGAADDATLRLLMRGDAFEIPPGHDAWVIGDEPWVSVDWAGRRLFARSPKEISDRIFTTVVFTDLSGSTETLSRLGDARWRLLLASTTRLCALTSSALADAR